MTWAASHLARISEGLYQMVSGYRKGSGVRMLLAKENKGWFQARSPSLRGSDKGSHHAGDLARTDQKIPDQLVYFTLGEVATAVKVDIKSWWSSA